jgi:tyrosyl-tRNA synthetase
VDNYDWFKDMNYLTFLREVGKNAPMSSMLSREFVQSRLGDDGAGISYAEFSYSLIQGYDFLHLFQEHGVTLQLCGADQWGNSVTGVDLIRRIAGGEAHVYSTPLIVNKATGVKFGKSEGGAVWLDANKTSVYQFYQFWLNADDEGVIDYMKIYTLLDKETVEDIERQQRDNPSARVAQKRLAQEVTTLVHGEERTKAVQKVTDALFGDTDFTDLSDSERDMLAAEIPTVQGNQSILEVMVGTGLAGSNGEARRLIEGGAVSVNGQKLTAEVDVVAPALIKKGKNSFVLVR